MQGVKDLNQPYIVQIENTAYCNRKCPWCPQSKLNFTKDMVMSWNTLDKIVFELHKLGYVNRIHPYGNGEPLTDNGFIDRVKFIKKRLPESFMYIATNGDYVNNGFSFNQLIDLGIDEIQCNHYDDKNQYLKINDNNKVIHYDIGMLRTTFYNRAGNIKLENIVKCKLCWFPGKKLFFNYLGDFLICCADWQYTDVVGNIHEQSLTDMINSEKVQMYQDKLQTGKSHELSLCSQCNLIQHREIL